MNRGRGGYVVVTLTSFTQVCLAGGVGGLVVAHALGKRVIHASGSWRIRPSAEPRVQQQAGRDHADELCEVEARLGFCTIFAAARFMEKEGCLQNL